MKSARWQRIEALFEAACGLAPQERDAWLRGEESDADILREVDSLLAADASEATLVESALGAGVALIEEEATGSGEAVLPTAPQGYRILSRIGFGGTSTVFQAKDPQGRTVALKLLRPELADGFINRRFEAERRTLERLRSPLIAELLDFGATSEGLPYVVTEYIDGAPFDVHCRDLELEKVLELFEEVCRGVQHAHRNLIIHRDLKPANILVSGKGEVKLLDFGLAAVLEAGPRPTVEPTVTAQRMLTPSCASPEQLRGDPLTTATDIYSLGVLLYQLCTGRHPQEPWRTSPGELSRAILEHDPSPPSAAVASSGDPEAGSPRRNRRISKDLDAIVLKALDKEPERRYGSVEQLAEDLRRTRAGMPVTARRATLRYRAAKFLRRHRWAAAAAAALGVSLVTFSTITTLQQRRTARAQERAEQSLAMLVDLLGSVDPRRSPGETLTAQDLLDRTLEQIPQELEGQPDIEATLLDSVGTLYLSLGTPDQAEAALVRAYELRRELLGAVHPDTARSLHHLARLREAQGDYEGAEEQYRRALTSARRSLGAEHPDVAAMLNGLADALHGQGKYEAAETFYREALELRRQILGDDDPAVAETLNHLGLLYHERGDLDLAESFYRQGLEIRRQRLGEDHSDTLESLMNLAALERSRGRLEVAEKLLRESLEGVERIFGRLHPEMTSPLQNLALLLLDRGAVEEAETLFRQEEQIYFRHGMEEHPTRGTNLYHLGLTRNALGDKATAEEYFRAAINIYGHTLAPHHLWQSFPRIALGEMLVTLGRASEAEPFLRQGLELRQESLEEGHWRTAEAQTYLGACLVELRRFDEARPLLQRGLGILEKTFGAEHRRSEYAREYLERLQ